MSIIERDYSSTADYTTCYVGAADIEALIHLVQTKVREQTTIELIHEVHIIGDC